MTRALAALGRPVLAALAAFGRVAIYAAQTLVALVRGHSGLELDERRLSSAYQRPFSGYYFRIDFEGGSWRSRSLWDMDMPRPPTPGLHAGLELGPALVASQNLNLTTTAEMLSRLPRACAASTSLRAARRASAPETRRHASALSTTSHTPSVARMRQSSVGVFVCF